MEDPDIYQRIHIGILTPEEAARVRRRRQPERNPLFIAVQNDDFNQLKSLVESGESVNITNSKGDTLLNFVIKHKRIEMFDYLLGLDGIDLDFVDENNQTALIFAASVESTDYFALQLIKNGANIHLASKSGLTYLHKAAISCFKFMVGKVVIEKGADINAQCLKGRTPLHFACTRGAYDWVCMLLYYGADVMIPCNEGILPVVVEPIYMPSDDQRLELEEMLFNYTFDDHKIVVPLRTLIIAMTSDSLPFPTVVESVADVTYTTSDLDYFCERLMKLKLQHLRLFVAKFGNIIKQLLDKFSILTILLQYSWHCSNSELKEFFDIFLESEHMSDFIQKSDLSYSTIASFIKAFSPIDEDIVKRLCFMLSYGLHVTSIDLDAVFTSYGHCELFKLLLHMDINLNETVSNVLARLCYEPTKNVEDFFKYPPSSCSSLLEHYSHPKLKDSANEDNLAKAEKLPAVALLVELSRNVARKYIVSKYHIKNSMQFYTILKWLPIGEMNRTVITLEKKLYGF